MSEKIRQLRYDTNQAQNYFTQRLAYTLGPVELKKFMEKGGVRIVDVRAKTDYDVSHIPEAISLPKAEIEDKLSELSKEEISIVYCYNTQCHLGESACLVLACNGFPTMLLEGGFKAWVEDFKFATVS